jgi:histidinol phosphatase-like enzyme
MQDAQAGGLTPRRIVFDLDGCLCSQVEGDYEQARPFPEAIAVVNRLYRDGYQIIIHTARFMGRNRNDMHQAYHDGYELTKRQLAAWGVLYHCLIMGKPPADVVVDDRAVFFTPQWELIERHIREELGGTDSHEVIRRHGQPSGN